MRAESFFSSRWVERPAGVKELDASRLPAGFRASGVACGIKKSSLDCGMLACDSERPTSAARFTKNAIISAPVELNLSDAGLDVLRAIVVSSGNANAYNGSDGEDSARLVRNTAAAARRLVPSLVGVAATGVTAVPLPVESVVEGVKAAERQLSPVGANDFAKAIITTDRSEKLASIEIDTGDGTVRISAQAKGAGMIAPSFSSATMLCFVETDAVMAPGSLDSNLDKILASSFERITVDSQLSPSDSFFIIASGESGIDCTESDLFYQALTALLRQLALEIAADGEGASHVARLALKGAHNQDEAERVARAVADSPLVKTAIYGNDPNWGRVLQAAGASIGRHSNHRERVEPSFWLEDRLLCEKAQGVMPGEKEKELSKLMQAGEIELTLDLCRGDHETEIFFSDLGVEYVKLNSEYMT